MPPEVELSDEAKDAIGHIDGSNLAAARAIGRGTKAPDFNPNDRVKPPLRPPPAEPERLCKNDRCRKPLPPPAPTGGRTRLYCCRTCQEGTAKRAQRARKAGLPPPIDVPPARIRVRAKPEAIAARRAAGLMPPAPAPQPTPRPGGYRITFAAAEVRCDTAEEAVALLELIHKRGL